LIHLIKAKIDVINHFNDNQWLNISIKFL
jgi:hypothetical protein